MRETEREQHGRPALRSHSVITPLFYSRATPGISSPAMRNYTGFCEMERDSVHGLCFISLICGPEGRYYFFSQKKKYRKNSTNRKAHNINCCFETALEAIGFCDQAITDLENITQQFSSIPKMDGRSEVDEKRGERDLCPPHEWVNTTHPSVFSLSQALHCLFFRKKYIYILV